MMKYISVYIYSTQRSSKLLLFAVAQAYGLYGGKLCLFFVLYVHHLILLYVFISQKQSASSFYPIAFEMNTCIYHDTNLCTLCTH